jgi:NADH-quinone oxidoreductase subunit D
MSTLEQSPIATGGEQPLYGPRSYQVMSGNDLGSQLLEVSMGPHHPSTHGVFRMDVVLDGEEVVKLKPVFGYLHRNHEQIAEKVSYLASMPYTDRLDYFCSMTNNWAYALSVEKLAGITVPERAEYIRVILAELTRLVNHTCLAGFFVNDLGALGTPLIYAFREREKILDVFEAISGARMMCNYMRFGGVRVDFTPDMLRRIHEIVDNYPYFLEEFEKLLNQNEIILARCQGVGVLSKELAINAGVTGPILRASGVDYDIRKVDKYGIYDRFDFRVPLGEKGDIYDRYMIRILEMHESLKILRQALKQFPEGPYVNPDVKLRNFKPKPGEVYGRIEAPKGELGFYLVSTGGTAPYRYHVRAPSFINLTVLEDMCIGQKVADVIVILGAVDIVLGEVDR